MIYRTAVPQDKVDEAIAGALAAWAATGSYASVVDQPLVEEIVNAALSAAFPPLLVPPDSGDFNPTRGGREMVVGLTVDMCHVALRGLQHQRKLYPTAEIIPAAMHRIGVAMGDDSPFNLGLRSTDRAGETSYETLVTRFSAFFDGPDQKDPNPEVPK